MIFVTHWYFRAHLRRHATPMAFRAPVADGAWLVGAVLMLAILLTTPFAPGFTATLVYGLPALAITIAAYYLTRHRTAVLDEVRA